MMKKILSTLLMLSIVISFAMPRRAQAFMTGSLGTAISISVMAGLAVEIQDARNGTFNGFPDKRPAGDKFRPLLFLAKTFYFYTFAGLLILDEESGMAKFINCSL
jgi:hypothetical protein